MLSAKLKLHYPEAIEWGENGKNPDDYFWLAIEDKKLGLPMGRLTEEEMQLLSSLFETKDSGIQQNRTAAQQQWHRFFNTKGKLPITNREYVRIFYFQLSSLNIPVPEFEQAFLSFFPDDSILIWEQGQKGIILENKTHEPVLLEELKESINVLESDFFVNIHMFSGNFHKVDERLRFHYRMEKMNFTAVLSHPNSNKISSLRTSFPFMLLKGIEKDKEWYLEELLGEIRNDDELIKTIKTYIRSGQNATSAAKELYIHRNSLQYRIDKFIDKTNLDIRTFHDAMLAYLSILMK